MSEYDERAEHLDVTGLLLGELGNREVRAAAAHLDDCLACRVELVQAAVGHGLLRATARTLDRRAPAGGSAPGIGPAAAPGAGLTPVVPTSRESGPAEEPTAVSTGATTAAPTAAPGGSGRIRGRGAGARRAGLVAAAAAGLAAGGLAGVLLDREPAAEREGQEPPAATATATLEPVTGTGTGVVTMTSPEAGPVRMTVEAHGLAELRGGAYYYAWLLDPETDKMLPLGQVESGAVNTFSVPSALLGRYSAVDVSLERDDGDPSHSPTSVLRGTYGETPSAT